MKCKALLSHLVLHLDPHPAECFTSSLIVSVYSCERFPICSLNVVVPMSCQCWVRAGATLTTHVKVGATSSPAVCVERGPGAAGGAWRTMQEHDYTFFHNGLNLQLPKITCRFLVTTSLIKKSFPSVVKNKTFLFKCCYLEMCSFRKHMVF